MTALDYNVIKSFCKRQGKKTVTRSFQNILFGITITSKNQNKIVHLQERSFFFVEKSMISQNGVIKYPPTSLLIAVSR